MKKLIIALVSIAILGSAITTTYFATRHYVFKQAYKTGYDVGSNNGWSKGYDEGYALGHKNGLSDMNKVWAETNKLGNQPESTSAPTQINVTPPAPTHCNSTTYGIDSQFTSTTCY